MERPCLVREKISGEVYEATFLKWGLDCIEYTESATNYTVGIIEKLDGTVKSVPPEWIQFLPGQSNGKPTYQIYFNPKDRNWVCTECFPDGQTFYGHGDLPVYAFSDVFKSHEKVNELIKSVTKETN